MTRRNEKSIDSTRERLPLNSGWKFHLGDIPFPKPVTHDESYSHGLSKAGAFQGAARMDYDDSSWRSLDLPHDWAVEGEFSPSSNMNHGYLPTEVAWYRKIFEVPKADAEKKIFLEFDGIFRDASVYLNGHFIGNEPSGYISVRYEIGDFLLYGAKNVLAVRVDALSNEGWWYEGAGIYRHVWLLKTSALHIKPWSLFAACEVEAKNGKALGPAKVNAKATVSNGSDELVNCELNFAAFDSKGENVATSSCEFRVQPGGSFDIDERLEIENPQLWSPDSPCLYTLGVELREKGKLRDSGKCAFGIRSAVFDPDKGFLLNGIHLKIKGTSNHQDHAGVGVAVPDKLHEFRIARMQEMGSNAWRCAHNPPAPEFLDACDRMGMLVLDETRCMSSSPEGLRQLEAMVLRDRNHPSIVVWGLGNEEIHHQGTETGKRIVHTMKSLLRKLDPTRPATVAMNDKWGAPLSHELDIQGINYFPDKYDAIHKKLPKLPILATETSPSFCTRGIYVDDKARCHLSAYDVRKTPKEWLHCATSEEAWKAVASRDFIAGLFPWTGFDYRGEPAPFGWPCVATNMGIVDLCGFPKDHFYYYQAWWSGKPVLHIFPHWTWPGREGQKIDVWCYSNCERIELFLNGASLGAKKMPLNGHLEWKVAYAPGKLSAKGFKGEKLILESEVETAGAPFQVRLAANREQLLADGSDIAVATASILDKEGRPAPDAENELSFKVSGPIRIIGLGNGDPSSHESDKGARRKAFSGLCQALLQTLPDAAGDIVLEASAEGLRTGSLALKSVVADRGSKKGRRVR